MKKGDKVIFTGASIEQTRWGGNDDPYKVMKEDDMLEIESVEVHSWHTKLRFVGIDGKYNAVCFEPKPHYINDDIKKG